MARALGPCLPGPLVVRLGQASGTPARTPFVAAPPLGVASLGRATVWRWGFGRLRLPARRLRAPCPTALRVPLRTARIARGLAPRASRQGQQSGMDGTAPRRSDFKKRQYVKAPTALGFERHHSRTKDGARCGCGAACVRLGKGPLWSARLASFVGDEHVLDRSENLLLSVAR